MKHILVQWRMRPECSALHTEALRTMAQADSVLFDIAARNPQARVWRDGVCLVSGEAFKALPLSPLPGWN